MSNTRGLPDPAYGSPWSWGAETCCTCGDPIDPKDADNFKRPEGWNKAGRTDCGHCIRLVRKIGTD